MNPTPRLDEIRMWRDQEIAKADSLRKVLNATRRLMNSHLKAAKRLERQLRKAQP